MKTFLVETASITGDEFTTQLAMIESTSLITAIAIANIHHCKSLNLPIDKMTWVSASKGRCHQTDVSMVLANEITQNAVSILKNCVTLVTQDEVNNFSLKLPVSFINCAA
ncbi:hypothetical protein [Photobacterium sp. GB-72]|uniref:hypothetical protein n=1 Tax=Photobacterium sp. GB-72 TaxID=2022105 RepID=UPI000D17AC7C|nr:hypothetical protein [Photobacterium sp. GB-72]PSV27619.1 hypothetical protein C9J40_19995 [Photobacterium sp. GB-72]